MWSETYLCSGLHDRGPTLRSHTVFQKVGADFLVQTTLETFRDNVRPESVSSVLYSTEPPAELT